MSRVFANVLGERSSIPGRVIPKTKKKWYLISTLSHPLHFGVVAIEKGAFGLPSTKVATFTYFIIAITLIIIFLCYFISQAKYMYFSIFSLLLNLHLSKHVPLDEVDPFTSILDEVKY